MRGGLKRKGPHTRALRLLLMSEWMTGKMPQGRMTKQVAAREAFAREVADAIGDGVLLHPTHPRVAPKHGQTIGKPWLLTTTAVFNLAGVPVAQIPLGLNDARAAARRAGRRRAGPRPRRGRRRARARARARRLGPPARRRLMAEPVVHQVLFYDYVENVVERRAPYRAGHLALVGQWKAEGKVIERRRARPAADRRDDRLPRRRTPRRSRRSSPRIPTCRTASSRGHRVVPWTVVV